MNKDNAAQFLPLVQALAEGKTIQFNNGTFNEWDWHDVNDPFFTDDPEKYRVKPEPREWDLWICSSIVSALDMSEAGWTKVRVREIID